MKELLLYVQDANALKNWSQATELPKKIISSLDQAVADYSQDDHLLLLQYKSSEQQKIEDLLQQGYAILLFSNGPSSDEGLEWFQKGVKGYLNTYSQVMRIEQAIETVIAGNIWLGQAVMQMMIQSVAEANKEQEKNDSWKELLSEREIETMEWVLQGMSNADIAEKMFISARTVKAHVHNMLSKLDAKDRLGLVLKVQNWHKP